MNIGESVRARLGNRGFWRWASFPVAVLVIFLVLVGLNLNGSSISILSPGRTGLVAGQPRAIRSDEWAIQTPVALSSVAQNLPSKPWIGLTPTDQAAASHGGPTSDWTEVLRPQDWGYLAIGESRGLAVSWWWTFTISLLGCFALIGFVTRRPLMSALLAIAATFTPYAGWWSAPAPGLFLGYAAMAGACLLAAWTVRRKRYAAAYAVAAGLFGVALTLVLYPPWEVSLAWVLVAVCGGYAIDARIGWRRFLWPVALGVGVSGVALGAWYGQHRDAIRAQTDTIYPGQRVNVAGTDTLSKLVDAPLNFWMTHQTGVTLGAGGRGGGLANLSEYSSTWLPLPVVALIMLGVLELIGRRLYPWVQSRRAGTAPSAPEPVAGEVARDSVPLWTLVLLSAAVLLLLSWSLVSLPSFIGKITQLQRTEPSRTPLALGLAVVLLVGAAIRLPGPRPVLWRWPFLVLAGAATAALTLADEHRMPWDGSHVSGALVLLSGFALGITFAGLLYSRAVVVGVAGLALAVYAVASWAPINPLQHGIGPIRQDPLVRRLESVTKGTDNPRVELFASTRNNFVTVAKIRASGLQSLTGTTFYPDAAFMRELLPSQERLWNNYLQSRWVATAPGTPAVLKDVRGTQMELDVPVCDPVILADANPGWVVSDTPLTATCLTSVSVVQVPKYPEMWIYRISS